MYSVIIKGHAVERDGIPVFLDLKAAKEGLMIF